MFSIAKFVLIYSCVVIFEEWCSVSVCGQQSPYPGVFYPPPPLTSAGIYPPPSFSFPFFPPFFATQFCPGPSPAPVQILSQPGYSGVFNGNTKPKIVKSFRVPVILRNRGDSNPPIVILTRSSRNSQQPSLLSPLTNLIQTFLKSLAPRTCDCDRDR